MTGRPRIAITMGDAAGIGPEIILKALTKKEVYDWCVPVVIGDLKALKRAEEFCHTGLRLTAIDSPAQATGTYGSVECLDMDLLPGDLEYGKVSAAAGHAAYTYLVKAIELCRGRAADAICTAPLNKEAMHKGGHVYPGHTEVLAEETGTKDFAMMFSSEELRVILVTIHDGLIDAIRKISPDRVYRIIKLAHQTLVDSGMENPRIAVCGLNPHAGEHGLFGYGEEENQILPGIMRARAENIDATGPLPGDTAFYLARRGDYDIVVAMYHDQGLGPIKVLGLEASVNITVGLPFIRTSVDHGTAFDIAGKGVADERNMVEAIRQAALLSKPRRTKED
jgi:4-phospho-D-threonate 3-dehydrogenase / 4-phospho-D-erythronate 3-dehydrogenase